MADPRYLPRAYTLDPLDFGREPSIRWRKEAEFDGLELDWLSASRFQHSCAVEIRRLVRQRFSSLSAFAEDEDLKYERFGRVLRGEVIMRVEDVAMATRTLGLRPEADWYLVD